MSDLTLPLLPYAGTSGWKGSEASRDRAYKDDNDGRTVSRQNLALQHLQFAIHYGMTWVELGAERQWHAGQASGVLSILHKEGLIVRLKERRNRCSVYVMPEYVNGRETAPHKEHGRTKNELCRAILAIIAQDPDKQNEDGEYFTDGFCIEMITTLVESELDKS